jgi:hypothetical protein
MSKYLQKKLHTKIIEGRAQNIRNQNGICQPTSTFSVLASIPFLGPAIARYQNLRVEKVQICTGLTCKLHTTENPTNPTKQKKAKSEANRN